MAELVPAIHDLTGSDEERRGYPGQARAWRWSSHPDPRPSDCQFRV